MSDNAELDAETGQEIVDHMDPTALAHVQDELSNLAPRTV